MKEIDARGLSCPQPIMKATEAIKAGDFPFSILVDTVTSCENVTRVAEARGCSIESGPEADGFRLVVKPT